MKSPSNYPSILKTFFHRNLFAAIALLVGVVVPWTIAFFTGNLDIPHNDAWSHSRIAQHFAATGNFQLLYWNRSALLGQVIVLGPAGKSIFIQQTFVALLAIATLISIYLLLRKYIGYVYAGISILLIAIYPGFSLLATSYMTDVPEYAAIFTSLLIANNSFEQDSRKLFIVSMAIGIWGCTIREQAIAAPVAIVITFLLQKNKFKNLTSRFVFMVASLSFLTFIFFEKWRSNLPGSDQPEFKINPNPLQSVVNGVFSSWFNLSLVTGVAVLIAIQVKAYSKRSFWIILTSSLVGSLVLLLEGKTHIFLHGNLSQEGSYAGVLYPVTKLIPDSFWNLIVFIAVNFAVISIIWIIKQKKNLNLLLTVFTVITLLGTVLELSLTQLVFDRYLVAFLPWLFLAIFSDTPKFKIKRSKIILSSIFGFIVFALSISLMLHSFAFDKQRWHVATELSKTGISKGRIYAGLEWVGMHSEHGAEFRFSSDENSQAEFWSFDYMFRTNPCYVLSSSNQLLTTDPDLTENWEISKVNSYKNYLFVGENLIYTYKTNREDCNY